MSGQTFACDDLGQLVRAIGLSDSPTPNSPRLSSLQQITQSVSPSIVATFRPPPDGIYGTVYIAAEVYGQDPLDDERSYGHELGNLIDGQICGWDATVMPLA